MQNLQAIDEIVNFAHETFHEDDFGETNAQVPELRGESLHLGEVVQLHSWEELEL